MQHQILSRIRILSPFSLSSILQRNMYSAVHAQKEHEFAIKIQNDDGGEEKALLQYEYIKPDLVDLYHTEVPPIFRGKGIAKILAKAALDHFLEEDVKIKLSCTYLQKYVNDNPVPSSKQHKITS